MRYLLGFVCVLALGVMGCGQGLGPMGGAGGGGVGGDGGQGGVGGGGVTDCTGAEDGTGCFTGGDPSNLEPGICVDGACVVPVEDCTDEDNYTVCGSDGSMVRFCFFGQCATAGCSGQEDGSYCSNPVLGDGFFGVCEAGECTKPEDCTGIADGVACTGGDGGFCEGGECVTPP